MKDLSVIIVSFKGWHRLRKCLESLGSFTGDQFSMEVIVVDNNSGDDTIYEFEKSFPEFIFIHNLKNGGFANGCNLGAGSADSQYLLFLNPDTIATETETRKLLLAARQNNDYSIVSCRQVNERGKESHATGNFPELWNLTGLQRSLAAIFKTIKTEKESGTVSFPDWVSGSVMLIRNDVFQRIGGFDEDFWMYYEDVDICRRIRNARMEIAFLRDTEIEHNHGGSSRINLKTASITKTEVHISKHVYISKHKSKAEKYLIQIFLVINNLLFGMILAFMGLLLFFIPKLFLKTLIFARLVNYYFWALLRLTWISPQSVNFKKTV
jgi:GT2 family glycosyltransferase